MLTYASVQSTVMQIAMAAPSLGPICGDMAGMGAMPGMVMAPVAGKVSAASAEHSSAKSGHHSGHEAPCPYCAAAAHVPIIGGAIPLRAPAVFVFTPFRVLARRGPRGPPSFQPRARGPPPVLTSL